MKTLEGQMNYGMNLRDFGKYLQLDVQQRNVKWLNLMIPKFAKNGKDYWKKKWQIGRLLLMACFVFTRRQWFQMKTLYGQKPWIKMYRIYNTS